MMLNLRVRGPFAAFRMFTAGAYRPSAPFLTPSAAYGLLLNIAGMEMRHDDGTSEMTLIADNLPTIEIALGEVSPPGRSNLFQQLHAYPVSEKTRRARLSESGAKATVQPARRELLVGLDVCVSVRGPEELETRIRDGLRLGTAFQPEGHPRYGLPFLGDNSFLPSHLDEVEAPPAAHWYRKVERSAAIGAADVCLLTVWIDRKS
ncbi:MAG: type I-MYXAN CRISPR-associated protein Cas5/Cmx5/DevS, partial [Dehalococcoidia bacterium]